MKPYNGNIEFKSIKEYKKHWDEFFEKWEKDSKATFEEDVIWKNREGTGEKKLEYDVFPQPYLGNIENHSVITLNLNPSRSKKGVKKFNLKSGEKGNENDVFEEKHLQEFLKKYKKVYSDYAESFPTYDTHPFWKKQGGWIDRIFKNLGKEKPSLKDIKPFAIEICPWGSKSFQKLKINEDDSLIKYMDLHVFDVIEKVIEHSKLKIVLSVGKAYYDIFNDSSVFIKLEEISSKLFDEEFTFLEDDNKTYKNCLEKSKKYEPEEKMIDIPYNWPMKFIKRSFSIWERGEVLYLNSYASGSNTPPAEHFDEIQNQLINKYLNKL